MDRKRGAYFRLFCAAVALVLTLGAATFSHYRLQGKKQQVLELRAEMVGMQNAISRARTAAATEPPSAERTVLANQAGLGDLLESLSSDLLKLNLGDRSIQTMPPVNTPRWQRFPLALSCKGDFASAMQFVIKLEAANPLIRIDRLSMTRDPREPQSPLTLQFALSAYARREVPR